MTLRELTIEEFKEHSGIMIHNHFYKHLRWLNF